MSETTPETIPAPKLDAMPFVRLYERTVADLVTERAAKGEAFDALDCRVAGIEAVIKAVYERAARDLRRDRPRPQ